MYIRSLLKKATQWRQTSCFPKCCITGSTRKAEVSRKQRSLTTLRPFQQDSASTLMNEQGGWRGADGRKSQHLSGTDSQPLVNPFRACHKDCYKLHISYHGAAAKPHLPGCSRQQTHLLLLGGASVSWWHCLHGCSQRGTALHLSRNLPPDCVSHRRVPVFIFTILSSVLHILIENSTQKYRGGHWESINTVHSGDTYKCISAKEQLCYTAVWWDSVYGK